MARMVTVYNFEEGTATEGVLVNNERLTKLANWLCGLRCETKMNSSDLAMQSVYQLTKKRNGGHCDLCRDTAIIWMCECPWIDIDKPVAK